MFDVFSYEFGPGQVKHVGSPVRSDQHLREHKRQRHDDKFIWHSTIAKGGTPVCFACCIPIGPGIESDIPEVINCSASTGLDMLAKHYAEAVGFDIGYFLPDRVDDASSYTEYLEYLGCKNRTGVAEFNDGTILFLVPPSDFLTKLLKENVSECLYGVVVKSPQQAASAQTFDVPPFEAFD